MKTQNIPKYISKFFEPTRVFIALMIAVTAWLFPFISFKEKTITPIEHGVIVSADPFTAGAIGECADVHCEPGFCCVKGYCKTGGDNCGPDDPPPSPPSISVSLNCSAPGNNGWCKGSLSLELNASDPQGQSVLISGTINADNFACPSGATSCSIPISGEGTGSITYRVDSATGLSAAGSTGYQIDVSTPNLNASVSGAAGTPPWYVSDATLSASGSDSISGLATIETNTDNGGWTSYGGPLTLTDGIHTVSVRAIDNAGNVSQTSRTIQVDTITPSLSFSNSGTNGKNGWYVSDASATPSASDSGSGIAAVEASVDGGGWSAVGSLSFTDGEHTYKFRAIDHAGNITETPMQYVNVDTTPPSIEMSQGTSLGDEVKYKIEDYGSGLSIYRAIIEDNGAQYQKAVWAGNISGKIIQSKILWDGNFGESKASVGEYMITMKVTDAAGNQSIATSYVSVNLLSFLQDLSGSTPPDSSVVEEEESSASLPTVDEPVTFGGIQVTTSIGEYVTTDMSVASTTIPFTNIPLDPNILWGAAATAMVGATLADWARKREEEERARREREAESNAGRFAAIAKAYNASKKNFNAYLNKAKEMGMSDAEVANLKKNVATTGKIGASLDTTKGYIVQKQDEAKAAADRARAADAARWAGAAVAAQAKEAAQQAAAQAALNHRMSEHDTTSVASVAQASGSTKLASSIQPPANTSWLSNIPFVGTQLNTAWQNSGLKQVWEQKVEPIIKPVLQVVSPKNLATAALTIGLGYSGFQWVNNVVTTTLPAAISTANQNFKTQILNFYEQNPEFYTHPKDENIFEYAWNNPYQAVDAGSDVVKSFTNITAGYLDALIQQHPLVQLAVPILEESGDVLCSKVNSQAIGNLCYGAFYGTAGLLEHPYDTWAGIANSWVVDPLAGLGKLAVFVNIENNPVIIGNELGTSLREGGWDAVKDYGFNKLVETWRVVTDPQVDSALLLLGLITLGIFATPVAAGVILGLTVKGLSDLVTTVTQLPSVNSVIDFVRSQQVRTTVVGSLLVLLMLGLGFSKQAADFNAYQEGMTATGKNALSELSPFKQVEITDLAAKMKLTPEALEFYLTESSKPGSPLALESITTGLKYSNILSQIESQSTQSALQKLPFPSQLKILGLGERPVPNSTNPVLRLTPQEIKVLTKISAENSFSEYAVLGTYNNGKGYTLLADRADLTYLNMPKVLYEFYKDYPADFKLINEQYIIDLAEQHKPIVLSVDYSVIKDWARLPVNERPTTYWEVVEILEGVYHYTLDSSPYLFEGKNYNVLIPAK